MLLVLKCILVSRQYPRNGVMILIISMFLRNVSASRNSRDQVSVTLFLFRHDFLIIGEGNTVDENIIISLSGSKSPVVTSPTNQMWLRFFSDGSVSAPGFSAIFYGQGNRID